MLYVDEANAFLLSDEYTAKIARAVISTMTSGGSLGGNPSASRIDQLISPGSRIVRGWDEVELVLNPKQPTSSPLIPKDRTLSESKDEHPKSPPAASPLPSATETEPSSSFRTEIGVGEFKTSRQTSHLILAIHGVGQQLGARTDAVNFVNGQF